MANAKAPSLDIPNLEVLQYVLVNLLEIFLAYFSKVLEEASNE